MPCDQGLMLVFAERFGSGIGQNESVSHSDAPDLRQFLLRISDD
jgi:hypothetical protein